ncbi:unnamed protein product [Oikopleura dioica]|uniref:Major facilitator superfamily (MFS) profile domain-containing protein n=1 Tax=Oikopleura dioica TaxID=34765 RepID=E4YS52_OIKDI|nr:unnamed protein product [Oikopleura dioica]
MCRGYVCILTTLCTLQLALAAAVLGMSIYAFAQAPVPDNTAPIVGLCVSCLAMGTSIFGILGTVFGKRLMVISHGVCTLFVIVVAAVGLVLSSLAAAQVSYFQGLVLQIQRNLIENAVIPDTISSTVREEEPSSNDRAGLFYDGFDVPDQYFYLANG